ncbi:MAG: 5-(carboxyamino)imidazole ribonucleotide mutase [Candidatus Altiarchaeales archaeon ex4484_96]|nr:MAG: 5-(carboxyamino)imidazole ribonucleotide mutase [Candidatus Altiarchaeales archaeon ex4484_96]
MDVMIYAGSRSDYEIVKKAEKILKKEHISYGVEYCSAHREPAKLRELVEQSDARVFICIAGLSAALPGVVASLTNKPVIGVPVSAKLGGLDALLSIAQMPKGVPVACVGVDNGANAAHLALKILSVSKN